MNSLMGVVQAVLSGRLANHSDGMGPYYYKGSGWARPYYSMAETIVPWVCRVGTIVRIKSSVRCLETKGMGEGKGLSC